MALALYFEAEGDGPGEVYANIVHARSRALTETAIPRAAVDLESGLEEQLGEAALELDLRWRPEADLQIFHTLVEDAQRDSNAQQSRENIED